MRYTLFVNASDRKIDISLSLYLPRSGAFLGTLWRHAGGRNILFRSLEALRPLRDVIEKRTVESGV